jgi:hypothetical protein
VVHADVGASIGGQQASSWILQNVRVEFIGLCDSGLTNTPGISRYRRAIVRVWRQQILVIMGKAFHGGNNLALIIKTPERLRPGFGSGVSREQSHRY